MISDLSDEVLREEIFDGLSSNGSVDLELVAHFRDSDGQELRCLLEDSLVELSIDEDRVVKLFLDLYLGPALLLCLSTRLLSWEGLGRLCLVKLGVFLIHFLGLQTDQLCGGLTILEYDFFYYYLLNNNK